MSTQDHNPYRGITPEELHIAVRRAHVERAKVIRTMFRDARAWLARIGERGHDARGELRTVARR
jgi:hypothetical protein